MPPDPTASPVVQPLAAMISSTALDLPEHRAAVREACLSCGVLPIGMEHLPARDATGITVSLEMVDKADIYLGIYAFRYGWVPDGSEVSITEMEFNRAIERQTQGKLQEILIFTAHKEHRFTADDIEADKNAQAALRKFKDRASSGRVRKEFQSVEELRRLVTEALHELKARRAVTVAPSPGPSAIPSNLPGGYIGRLFLGRDDFLERLRQSLLNQTHHATAITQNVPAATSLNGLGGIGKTHTAIEYADKFRGDYSALLFVQGDTPARLQASLAALCGVLHLDADEGLPEPQRVAAAVEWLASHRGWLLIVDNVDDPAAAKLLTDYLGQLTNGHVLITTRLHHWADNVTALDLSVLDPDHAAQLLLNLTQQVHSYTSDDRAAARLLAIDLGGLPLAIHQAAGYIVEQHLPLPEARAFYQDQARDLLGWFDEMRIPYAAAQDIGPQPVLFTWKASFDRLTPDTRRWLRVFAHYAPETIPDFLVKSQPNADEETKTRHQALRQALAQADKYCLITRERDPLGFKLHRLVQHIIRLTSSELENATALDEAIQLIFDCKPGDPLDFNTWVKWNLLQSHAAAIGDHAQDKPAPKRLIWLLNQLGELFYTKALYSQAEPLFRCALSTAESRLGKDHTDVAECLNNLGGILLTTNRLAEAEPLMRRALKIDEANFGKDHPTVAIRLNNLAQLLKATNRLDEAEPLFRRALKIDEASFGPDHPDIARDLNNLAQLLQTTDRLNEAEPMMRRALAIAEANYGKDHPTVAIRLNNLARLLQDKNRLAEAEPLMRRALEILVTSLGNEHPNSQVARGNYEILCQEMEDLKR